MQPRRDSHSSSSKRARGVNKKALLHNKFSKAAMCISELYRESTDAYESGYKDALLRIQQYVLLTTGATSQAQTCDSPTSPLSSLCATAADTLTSLPTAIPLVHSPSGVFLPEDHDTLHPSQQQRSGATLSADSLLRYISIKLQQRRELIATVRGVGEARRRTRGDTYGEECDEFGSLSISACSSHQNPVLFMSSLHSNVDLQGQHQQGDSIEVGVEPRSSSSRTAPEGEMPPFTRRRFHNGRDRAL